MTDVDALKKKLATLQSAQKENEQAVMRAEIAQEEAKKKVLEASKRLKDLGFSSVGEAEEEIARLDTEITEYLDKAAQILGVE